MRFAKAQEKKMGKPESNVPVVKKQGPQKSPISKAWISTSPFCSLSPFFRFRIFIVGVHWRRRGVTSARLDMNGIADIKFVIVVLAFVLCGGLLFEVLRLFF